MTHAHESEERRQNVYLFLRSSLLYPRLAARPPRPPRPGPKGGANVLLFVPRKRERVSRVD